MAERKRDNGNSGFSPGGWRPYRQQTQRASRIVAMRHLMRVSVSPLAFARSLLCHVESVVIEQFTSHCGEPSSIPRRASLVFLHADSVAGVAFSRCVYSDCSLFLNLFGLERAFCRPSMLRLEAYQGTACKLTYDLTYTNTHALSRIRTQNLPRLRAAHQPTAPWEVDLARRNERVGGTGDPRENPSTNGIVRRDYHMLKSSVARPGLNLDRLAVRLLASHQGRPSSIPGLVNLGFPQLGIVLGDVPGRRVFSGTSRLPLPCIPALLHSRYISPSSALEISF
ncbi:hypothetical protein PR048_031440 [Dryococelus australis]|uniref:Uncharacterized protein n=1 Tax=Dryococelus australis TaxID=614101 RepID=A0ABQ9G5A7_9NEOP|nr:hypothetical protein PR048_031440 [Dryococelus australis]